MQKGAGSRDVVIVVMADKKFRQYSHAGRTAAIPSLLTFTSPSPSCYIHLRRVTHVHALDPGMIPTRSQVRWITLPQPLL